ncbi:helix-hairpin-helix domain-containing protein [Clostridium algidicarnis]|nr:helix-hairpin-helix domain-containing protein [Clostridium algidicarnis]MBU3209074.1 helix-hairpin-helix domain-containing protein [Clostridium algidicarnis]MBU3228948.1 helix-hairpin-helix domain-containing protein [Clostridium algidicarnis]MBU3252492.1 helix-hairpin-helix domain-containing protein [Clostridium algidicarnis]
MKNKEKYIGIAMLSVIFMAFFIANKVLIQKPKVNNEDIFVSEKQPLEETKAVSNKERPNGKKITVEIKGEVKKPEVYVMEDYSIVKDVIVEAGGVTEKGDLNSVNQAKKLRDGDCIIIPSIEGNARAIVGGTSRGTAMTESKDEIININTATKEELMKLPGVGEVTAGKIIDYRESSGGFSSVEDMKNISGIGDKTLAKFKDKIDVR